MTQRTDHETEALIAALGERAARDAPPAAAPTPDPETLLAYLAGELPADEETRLQRRLVADPEAARALLDLEELEQATAAAADERPPELATGAAWRELRARLRGIGRGRAVPWLGAIAAALLVVTVGLGVRVVDLERQRGGAVAGLQTVDLISGRAAADSVELASGTALRLVVRPPEPRCESYRAQIGGPRQETLSLTPNPLGNLEVLLLPPVPAGSYSLRLTGCDPPRELAEHHFAISRPDTGGHGG